MGTNAVSLTVSDGSASATAIAFVDVVDQQLVGWSIDSPANGATVTEFAPVVISGT